MVCVYLDNDLKAAFENVYIVHLPTGNCILSAPSLLSED